MKQARSLLTTALLTAGLTNDENFYSEAHKERKERKGPLKGFSAPVAMIIFTSKTISKS